MFAKKTFTNGRRSAKFAKVFSLESFPLYGSSGFDKAHAQVGGAGYSVSHTHGLAPPGTNYQPSQSNTTSGEIMATAPSSSSALSDLRDRLKQRAAEKYRPPRFDYNELQTEKQDFFLVLDFEAVINKDPGCPDVMEMIEFPVLKVNARTMETESTFHTYVQPVIHEKLNPVCTEITGITQDMVDGQPTLPETLAMLDEWMKKEGLLEKDVHSCFVTCGD